MSAIAAADIAWRSHWLQQVLRDDPDLAPPLNGDIRADICIVGGGFLGLWTAIRLKEADPSLDVVVLEKDICGGGVSGRNSGMLLSAWTKFSTIAALRNDEASLQLIDQSSGAIDGIERFCAENGIDCWFDRVGWIWGATCAAQIGAWQDALGKLAKYGRHPARPVTREEIAAMSGTSAHLAGAFDASAATIHPAISCADCARSPAPRRCASTKRPRCAASAAAVRSRSRHPAARSDAGSSFWL